MPDTILCAQGSPHQPNYACVLSPGHGEGHCFVPMVELYAELDRRVAFASQCETSGYDAALQWLQSVLQPIRDSNSDAVTATEMFRVIDAALAKVSKT